MQGSTTSVNIRTLMKNAQSLHDTGTFHLTEDDNTIDSFTDKLAILFDILNPKKHD